MKCLNIDYIRTRESGDYATEKRGSVLYIYLEHSDGWEDWKNNVQFSDVPYEIEEGGVMYAHCGFLNAWRAIGPHLYGALSDPLSEE